MQGPWRSTERIMRGAAMDWEQARANLPADIDPEMTQQLMAAIAEAQSQLGGGQETVSAYTEPSAPGPANRAAALRSEAR